MTHSAEIEKALDAAVTGIEPVCAWCEANKKIARGGQ